MVITTQWTTFKQYLAGDSNRQLSIEPLNTFLKSSDVIDYKNNRHKYDTLKIELMSLKHKVKIRFVSVVRIKKII